MKTSIISCAIKHRYSVPSRGSRVFLTLVCGAWCCLGWDRPSNWRVGLKSITNPPLRVLYFAAGPAARHHHWQGWLRILDVAEAWFSNWRPLARKARVREIEYAHTVYLFNGDTTFCPTISTNFRCTFVSWYDTEAVYRTPSLGRPTIWRETPVRLKHSQSDILVFNEIGEPEGRSNFWNYIFNSKTVMPTLICECIPRVVCNSRFYRLTLYHSLKTVTQRSLL